VTSHRRSELPSEDVPSAEVLDELLQAFSIDVTDRARFDEIDLSSPEVERLLTPAETPRPELDAGTPRPEVETPPQPDVEAPVEASEAGPEPDVETPVEASEAGSEPEVETPLDESEAAESEPAAEAADSDGEAADGDAPDGEGEGEPARQAPVVITDDEIPDAVYIKGSLATDSSGERSTVFIDDGHATLGETISIEAAAAATRIEPRLRDRRMAVKKAATRKRLKWVLIATAAIAIIVGGLAVLGSSFFDVQDVEVEGAVYTDDEALAEIVEDLRGSPVLRIDTDAVERRVEEIPWVRDARVTTDFPHGVKIEIRERQPAVAFEGDDGRFRVIDDDGRVLDVLRGQPVDYLLLTSSERPSLAAGQFSPEGFGAAASLVQALTPRMSARAESVSVTPDGSDLRLMLRGGTEVRFGAAEDLIVKLVRLQTVLEEHAGEPLSVIDVATNEVTIR
jgi:cell division protein FtsQ